MSIEADNIIATLAAGMLLLGEDPADKATAIEVSDKTLQVFCDSICKKPGPLVNFNPPKCVGLPVIASQEVGDSSIRFALESGEYLYIVGE